MSPYKDQMQKVLIAEDNKTIRGVLGLILARECYEMLRLLMDRLHLRRPVRSLQTWSWWISGCLTWTAWNLCGACGGMKIPIQNVKI